MLATESWKRTDTIKLREAASGEKLLLHQPILLASFSSSSLPAAWWVKCRRTVLLPSEELDTCELMRKGISPFQAAVIVPNLVPSDSEHTGSPWALPSSLGQGSELGETSRSATAGPLFANDQ